MAALLSCSVRVLQTRPEQPSQVLCFSDFLLYILVLERNSFTLGKLLYPVVHTLAFSIENLYLKHVLLYYHYQQYLKILNLRYDKISPFKFSAFFSWLGNWNASFLVCGGSFTVRPALFVLWILHSNIIFICLNPAVFTGTDPPKTNSFKTFLFIFKSWQ